MNAVEVKNLSKIFFRGDTEIKAVNDISFEAEDGEMLAITGSSGSGKTTLLNLIGGIEEPTDGEIFIYGTDITLSDKNELARIRRQKIGYIFQDFNLIPILTVKENIIMPLLLDSKKANKKRLIETVRYLGLEDRLDHLPSQLSGGQKQRAAIARAIINSPGIILADEPTGNLDRAAADGIMKLLLDLNKNGMTVILVTHDERYADMCDRKISIEDGKII